MSQHTPTHSPDHAPSWYAASARKAPAFPVLQGEAVADVCIVGGGFTGVNCALELAQRGYRVVLLESRLIGWGASGRNGGQLIRGLGHNLARFTPLLGQTGVQRLTHYGLEAVELVRQRIEQLAIDCDLTWGYCDLANRPQHLEALQAEQVTLTNLGYRHALRLLGADEVHEVVGSSRYCGGLIDMGSGHLQPLDLLHGEALAAAQRGAALFERSAVTRIDYGATLRIHTAHGVVRSPRLILAGNAYLGALEPQLSAKVLPAGSYIIATEPLPEALAQALIPRNMALCDQRVALDYYRLSRDRRLLFGGACHYSGRDPADIARYMRPKMLAVFPQLAQVRIDYAWGGMIGIGANRLPQIGRLPAQPNVWYAQAYAGHGLNTTHLAAHLLAQAVHGEDSTGFDLFAAVPHPTFPGGPWLRAPLLALGMLWERLKERL
ncbi:FAD-binding oxidoreductase [Pseudomonas sp. NW5]|uniref:NAD(P)/FAD-dependent oxidoreductase n=1 Tax=Pseudomonas sp. NW5 TaxID=2934934 RepID=UPI00202296AC|nr:FAD-binding oxidoreductase [Pseudomonas sp. NW5]MCL7463072.1 FAD-binding oxidoreductase [Pseudomonas sp. NW5]